MELNQFIGDFFGGFFPVFSPEYRVRTKIALKRTGLDDIIKNKRYLIYLPINYNIEEKINEIYGDSLIKSQ